LGFQFQGFWGVLIVFYITFAPISRPIQKAI
jgi:hypothetical protein